MTHMFIYHEPKKLLVCASPKAACSALRLHFLKLSGRNKTLWLPELQQWVYDTHDKTGKGAVYVHNMPNPRAILEDPAVFKAIFVRNPYTRLQSAFRNKFLLPRGVDSTARYSAELCWKRCPKEIREIYEMPAWLSRACATWTANSTKREERRPTFKEFVRAIGVSPIKCLEEHWAPQSALCGISSGFDYSFVGKTETMDRDLRDLFGKFGLSMDGFRKANVYAEPYPSELAFDKDMIEIVRAKYADDLILFQYQPVP